ncbi:MAG: hypothetical protein EPN93_03355 [Spirochaetes bacterium]|nr:MAG: hypothetical protein EPN93_03355 [Spirochaetota bacterium]
MITDAEIKQNGIKALIESLGLVEAERFIALLRREPFDYTRWRKNLWEGKSVREISKKAMKFRYRNEEN